MRFLLDSNTVNYILRAREPVLSAFEARTRGTAVFFVSDVVDYELRRYLELKGAKRKLGLYEQLTELWVPVGLETAGWRLAARLWADLHRDGRSIEDRDLLIAVTALQAQATLVTSNTRHFQVVPGLDLEDWQSLDD